MWEIAPADPPRALALARACGVEPAVAQCLLNRGVATPDDAARFLQPTLDALTDPFSMPAMDEAVSRIRRAIASREPILIFGDSDVDGITASAILYEALRSSHARAFVRLSNRLADGYGFPRSMIRRAARFGITLVILVDCGTNQPDEVDELARLGIDTVIFDHHVQAQRRPRGAVLVNPRLEPSSDSAPCSAGLALKLVQALAPDAVEQALDLAALGTLADYATLRGDNRMVVAAGLERILSSHRPGLRRLCHDVQATKATPEHVLRRIVPRLNAAGRLGNPRPVWRLLVESSEPRSARWSEQVGGHHQATKALHRQLVAEAHEQASRIHFKDQLVMIVGRPGWHPGLMGPIAAQLVDRFERPAIALALEETVGTGSGRSIEAFNLFEALRACEGMLMRYGGHPQACGLTISASQIDGFRGRINEYARQALARRRLIPRLKIDVVLALKELTSSVAEAFEAFRPFGPGNPQPVVMVRGARVVLDGNGGKWITDGDQMVKVKDRSLVQWPDGPCDLVTTTSVSDSAMTLSALDVGEAGHVRAP